MGQLPFHYTTDSFGISTVVANYGLLQKMDVRVFWPNNVCHRLGDILCHDNLNTLSTIAMSCEL